MLTNAHYDADRRSCEVAVAFLEDPSMCRGNEKVTLSHIRSPKVLELCKRTRRGVTSQKPKQVSAHYNDTAPTSFSFRLDSRLPCSDAAGCSFADQKSEVPNLRPMALRFLVPFRFVLPEAFTSCSLPLPSKGRFLDCR